MNPDTIIRPRYFLSILTLVIFIISVNVNAQTTTHYVSLSGSNIAPYSSWATASTNVQSAIDAADTGDLILVEDGTYILTTNISVTKAVTIRSVNGSASVIVDGNNSTRCFYINNTSAVIDGFTMTNGYASGGYGGGVQIDNGTVQNCIIENSRAQDGGGVALNNAGLVFNSIIRNNTAVWGGGIRFFSGTARNCLITGNTANPYGGGINIWSGGTVQNCTITNNTATDGAGIRLWNNGIVENSIIYFNNGSDNYIINSGAGNSLSYSCTTPLYSGTGNISADPQFVNTSANDYQLQPTSPCINVGLNETWMTGSNDLGGHNRIFNSTVDMGAYEYTITNYTIAASVSGSGGIINPSGNVSVTANGNQSFSITPNTGYHVSDVLVDGSSVGAVTNYTFNNVLANHTITASFGINTYTLTITSANGTIIKNPDQANYSHGSTVQLTVTPLVGYTFTNWSGDATGSVNPLTVTMDGNINITANYSINTHTLTITSANGTVTKNPDQATYNYGTNVILTATAGLGYHFLGWSGDASGSTNPLTVTMNGNKNIKANFLPLNVIAFDDFDRANESPFIIGGNWTKSFGSGIVNLTNNQVLGSSGEALYYWQGSGSFNNTRQFARARVVNANGQVGLMLLGGNNQALCVSWNTGTLYIYWYLNGSHQGELAHISSTIHDGDIIEAVLDAGMIYAKINGTIVHSVANTTSLTSGNPGFEFYLSGAIFDDWEAGTPPITTYTITSSAGAGGTISPSGSVSVNAGNNQSFAIAPNTGYHISDVLVDASSVGAVTNYSFNNVLANHTIAASFAINTYALTITSTNGTVIKNPDQANYSHGSTVQLTATPTAGYSFTNWSGSATGSTNPLTVTMDGNKNITANFTINTYSLTITSVHGTVTKNPDQTNYSHGSTVQLTATPSSGYLFNGWGGDAIGATNPLSINMNANKNITANFAIDNNTYIEIGSASVYSGSSITIPVRVHFGSGSRIPQYILQGKIFFDPAKLKYRTNSVGSLFTSSGWTYTGYSAIVGQFDFVATGNNAISTDGILFNLNFDIISNTTESTQLTSSLSYWLSNNSASPVIFTAIHNGTIDITSQSTSTTTGDVDGNFCVDFNDAMVIINHVLSLGTLNGQALINADVNHNGSVTLADAIGVILYCTFGDWNYSLSILSPWSNAFLAVENPVINNENIIIPLNVKNTENVRSLEVTLDYDPAKYNFESFSAGIASSNVITKASQVSPGKAKLIFASNELINNNFSAGNIVLKSNSGALINGGTIKTHYKINDGKEIEGPSINSNLTDVSDLNNGIPTEFALEQNYPNPFNPTTSIEFKIPIAGYYVVKVYNTIGQTVALLADKEFSAGNYRVTFNGTDLSSGIYFYQLRGNSVNIIKKMMLIK